MVEYLLKSYLSVVLVVVSINGGRTQECNEWINVTSDTTELFVNTTINRTCLQCITNTTASTWLIIHNSDTQQVSNGDPIDGFEVVNGVLVIPNPMEAIPNGRTDILEVQCGITSPFVVRIYSSAFIPPVLGIGMSKLTVIEGTRASVFCTDNNIDQLKGTGPIWLDPDGNTVGTTFLQINNITRSQAGNYHCEIRSRENETFSTVLTILVQYGPILTSVDSSTMKLLPSSILILSCVFNGVPIPTITWLYNNNTILENGGMGNIVTNSNRSELTVLPGTEERGGVYSCTANNTLGHESLGFNIQFFPEAVSGLTITSRTESTASLNWTYQSDWSSARTGVEIEIRKSGVLVYNITEEADLQNITISSLQPLTSYSITIYVVSAVGRSEPSTVMATTLSLRVSQPIVTIFLSQSPSEALLIWQPSPIMANTTAPVTAWRFELSLVSGATVQSITKQDPSSTSMAFTGLAPGIEYRVRVAGINARGTGEFSRFATTKTFQEAMFTVKTGVSLIVIIVILMMVILIMGIVILVCGFKNRTSPPSREGMETNKDGLTPCPAYGVFKGNESTTVDPTYEMVSLPTTTTTTTTTGNGDGGNDGRIAEYDIFPEQNHKL